MKAVAWLCSRCLTVKATFSMRCPQPVCENTDCDRFWRPLRLANGQLSFVGSEDW